MIRLTTLLTEAKLKLNIPSDIKKLHKLFKKNGKQLYVVGGAVRDAILGKSPKDFDLATDAKPEEVIKIAKNKGIKVIEKKIKPINYDLMGAILVGVSVARKTLDNPILSKLNDREYEKVLRHLFNAALNYKN